MKESKNRNKNGAGKGDAYRKVDLAEYEKNYDRIFREKK